MTAEMNSRERKGVDTLMHRLFLIPVVCFVTSCVETSVNDAPTTSRAAEEPAASKNVILSHGQYYRLPVAQVNPRMYTAFSTAWTFDNAFPAELLASIKAHPNHRAAESDPTLTVPEGETTPDSGYIRWVPDVGDQHGAAALLWYLNGEDRKELVVSVDILLSQEPTDASREDTFPSLSTTIDFKSSTVSRAEFAGRVLTEIAGTSLTHELRVSFTGSLTKKGYQTVQAADQLQAGDVTRALDELWQLELKNESHHGITLGWLGYEHLRHGLLFVTNHQTETIEFQYSVSGEAFPLDLVRRQLADGWPLVLRGYEHAGSTEDGSNVFHPVEYMLLKEETQRQE